ncbi:MAG: HNH endonuclease [Saprospiraceae bacterium]
MIKVNPYSHNVPDVLNNETTQKRRNELIDNKEWLGKRYEKYYQENDIRKALRKAYHNKCAFCEQTIKLPKKNCNKSFDNDLTVEHFRPKSIYYWLAYSYDNLLPACKGCNENKGKHFEILGTKINEIRGSEIDTIHSLTESYNQEELPKFIHPELEGFTLDFVYQKDGTVESENERCQYVIKKCDLKRSKLIFKRRKIIDDLKSQFQAIRTEEELYKLLKTIKAKSENSKTEFVTLYSYILKNFNKIIL